jgi:26S proteasome regulatory subunit N2
MCHAIMNCGTTTDTFLRENLDWSVAHARVDRTAAESSPPSLILNPSASSPPTDRLGKATNWAKFIATASIGVIHRGHYEQSIKLLTPYLPQHGQSGSPYSEGGALYALGLIHANHNNDQTPFLLEALRNAGNNEIVQHGCCLGIGLTAMATGDQPIYDILKA